MRGNVAVALTKGEIITVNAFTLNGLVIDIVTFVGLKAIEFDLEIDAVEGKVWATNDERTKFDCDEIGLEPSKIWNENWSFIIFT